MEQTLDTQTTQYLTFELDEEVFAFEISRVREVLEYGKVTKVPQTPDMLKGVINLRGSVVPVIDLRVKFGMTEAEQTINTVTIITEIQVDQELCVMGTLVDSVKEVIDLTAEDIDPPPKIGTKLKTDFILGMGKKNDQFIIILDIEKIFNSSEFEAALSLSQNIDPALAS